MSSTQEVAQKLVALCRKGDNLKAVRELYAADIVSVEPMEFPPMPAVSRGLEAVLAKTQWWLANHEVHSAIVGDPYVHGDKFIVFMDYDVTFKPTAKRMKMAEMALYYVTNGKISREEFFFGAMG